MGNGGVGTPTLKDWIDGLTDMKKLILAGVALLGMGWAAAIMGAEVIESARKVPSLEDIAKGQQKQIELIQQQINIQNKQAEERRMAEIEERRAMEARWFQLIQMMRMTEGQPAGAAPPSPTPLTTPTPPVH